MAKTFLVNPISWYYTLDKTQTIEFWVAFGTILLALVTSAAVIISLSQNMSEHKRFEQGYAPLVEILHFSTQGNLFNQMSLQNTGYGPALNIQLRVIGTWLKRHYEELPPPSADNPAPPVRTELLPFRIEGSHSMLMPGDAWGFYIKDYGGPEAIDQNGLDAHIALVNYEDRFGNAYSTRYVDFNRREHEWIRPKRFGRSPTK